MRTPKTLAIGSVQSTDLNTVYTTGNNINTTLSKVTFTNTTENSIVVSIYYSDGSTDFIQDKVTIPSGAGRSREWHQAQRSTLLASYSIKFQTDNTNKWNYFISGSEIEL